MRRHDRAECDSILLGVATDDSSSSADVDPAISRHACIDRDTVDWSDTVAASVAAPTSRAPVTRWRFFLLKHRRPTLLNNSVTHSGRGVLATTTTPIFPYNTLRGDTTRYSTRRRASSRSTFTDTSGATTPAHGTLIRGTGSNLTALKFRWMPRAKRRVTQPVAFLLITRPTQPLIGLRGEVTR